MRAVHSDLKFFTGLARAVLMACMLTVSNVTSRVSAAAIRYTVQFISVRYLKSWSQRDMAHQARGEAMRMARPASFIKSPDRMKTRFVKEAPNTLRMPISFTRCLAE